MEINRAPIKPSHIVRRERRLKFRKRVWIVFLTLILLGGLIYSTHARFMRVETITIEGNRVVDTREVNRLVEANIKGNAIFVFPKNNIFLVRTHSLENTILRDFPRIEMVSITKHYFHELKIVITERKGTYLWCGALLGSDSQENASCYFVDDTGYIFSPSPYFSGGAYFKFYGGLDANEVANPVGAHILEEDTFASLVHFTDQILALGFESEALEIQENGTYSILLSKNSDKQESNTKIIFTKDNTLDDIYKNLVTALSSADFKREVRDNRDRLLYIDLRFTNKIYYKFAPATASF